MLRRFFGGNETNAAHSQETDVVEAHKLQKAGAQLIDVREPAEFAAGHAKGARNIPLSQLAKRSSEIKTDTMVLLICQSGNRSRTAQNMLQQMPNISTLNVKGGTRTWPADGIGIDRTHRPSTIWSGCLPCGTERHKF
jgi:rhodanese-related sulfurtransferase